MNRREALRGVGGGLLAGLAGVGSLGLAGSRYGTVPLRVDATVEQPDELPVRVTADVLEERLRPGSAARLRLAVENVSDDAVALSSGIPAPFGVLLLGGGRLPAPVLWTDAYEEHSAVDVGPVRRAIGAAAVETTLEPGDEVAETYRIRPSEPLLRPGSFEVRAHDGSGFVREFGDDVSIRVSLDVG